MVINIILIINLYLNPVVIDYLIPYNLTLLGSFVTILFSPVTEEIIYRYWAYGKNIRLQFSLFITFILYNIIDFIQIYIFDFLNFSENHSFNGIIKNILVILIGFILFFFIKKYNYRISNFFIKLTQSRLTYIFIILLFALAHLYDTELNYENSKVYLDYFISSYLVTRHARDYGIYFAILIHIAMNAIAVLGDALIVRMAAKNFVLDHLLINYTLIAVFFVGFYLFQFLRTKPLKIIQR